MASNSDSGAFMIRKGQVLLQNVDFITPLVNDPFTFGAIAATNALSDVFTMGGRVLTALNVLSYPNGQIDTSVINNILRGGLSKVQEANGVLLGGHTTDNNELVFGLSVTGVVAEKKMITNSRAQVGDHLVLTKPIGNTIVALTSSKDSERLPVEMLNYATVSMTLLNKYASDAMKKVGVNSATDVTGFGFLGHLWELCISSGVGVEIDTASIPLNPGSLDIVSQGAKSSARARNYTHLNNMSALEGDCGENILNIMCEAETSGGLLISVEPDKSTALINEINKRQKNIFACLVGNVKGNTPKINIH